MKSALKLFFKNRLFWPMQITVVIIILLALELGVIVDSLCFVTGLCLILYVFGIIPNPFHLIR